MTGALRLAGPVIAAVALVAIAAASAAVAVTRGRDTLATLDRADVALARIAPIEGAGAPAHARRVVLVVIDGLGADVARQLPTLAALGRRGAVGIAVSHAPTISRPNYVSILVGVPPLHSGVRSNAYAGPVPLDSLFRRVRATGGRTAFVTDAASSVATLFAGDVDEAAYTPWTGGFRSAAALALGRDYPFVLLLPSAIDQCGHRHRMNSAACLAALATVDAELDAIVGAIDLERDAIVVTADHGHVAGGGHGGAEREVIEVPLVLAGAGVRAGTSIAGARLIDVAPTVAALLGVSPPGHGLGRTLRQALALAPGVDAAVARNDAIRVARNGAIVDAEQARGRATEARARRGRLAWLAAGLLVALAALACGHRVGVVRIGWPALLAGVLGLPVTATALFASADASSLSCFGDLDGWARRIALTGVFTTVSVVALLVFVLRGHRALVDRLTTVNGVAAVALMSEALAAGVVWAVWAPAPITLPGPLGLFLSVAIHVVVAPHAVAIGIALAIELGATTARATGSLPFATPRGEPLRVLS